MDTILLEDPYLFEYFALVIILFAALGLSRLEKFHKFTAPISAGLIAVPVLYFYLIVSAHILNIPYMDDYDLLETIFNLKSATDFSSGVKAVFQQVNQHRFAFERVVMMMMVFFSGTVNIKLQIMLGNIFMLGVLYFFFLVLKKEHVCWYYFIPVPFLLFNLVYFENAIWGIAALQNTPLIFFAFLTVYLLSKGDHRAWSCGLLTALLATFISGSGMLTWIIGAVILLLQKRYKLLIQWVSIASLAILFYFRFNYQLIPTGNQKVWHHPLFNAITLLGFWGNALYMNIPHPLTPAFYSDMILCVLLGLGILGVCLGWMLRMYFNKSLQWNHWFLLGTFMFIMGTGGMFMVSRPSNNFFMYGGNILSRRYMIFGVVLLAITYTGLIVIFKKHKNISKSLFGISMLCCIALNFTSYFMSITSVRKLREELLLDAYYWKNYNTFLSVGNNFGDKPFWNHPTKMKNLVNNLEKSGLINLYEADRFPKPVQLISNTAKRPLYASGLDIVMNYRTNTENEWSHYLQFKVKRAVNSKPSYFILASARHAILLPALPMANSLENFLRKRTYYDTGYEYSLYQNKLPKGNFGIWLLSKKNDVISNWESRYTGEKIHLF